MNWRICGAPGAWGIEDKDNPNNPPYTRVLDDTSKAGYKGIELGPYGYMPMDIEILTKELKQRDLIIVAGTIFDDLVSEDNCEDVLRKTRETCELISKLEKPKLLEGQRFDTPYLVIIDAIKDERSSIAGHPDKAEPLNDKDWNNMVEHIKKIAKIAKEYGIRAVVHPHAGGYIEFDFEIERIMKDINKEEIGLCLDVGHLYYSKMDPYEYLHLYKDRLDYVHFKDIDKDVYEDVLSKNMGFFEGCAIGTMCAIGSGCVNYAKVKQALTEINYNGYITIEQERDPLNCDESLGDAKKSIEYLKKQGFEI